MIALPCATRATVSAALLVRVHLIAIHRILAGHEERVLYLAVSPDGQKIVTGAADETFRFWNIFPPDATGGIRRGCAHQLQRGSSGNNQQNTYSIR